MVSLMASLLVHKLAGWEGTQLGLILDTKSSMRKGTAKYQLYHTSAVGLDEGESNVGCVAT